MRITTMHFSPGDVLVVQVDAHLSEDDVNNLKRAAQAVIGDDHPVLVIGRGISLAVLTRSAVDQRAAA